MKGLGRGRDDSEEMRWCGGMKCMTRFRTRCNQRCVGFIYPFLVVDERLRRGSRKGVLRQHQHRCIYIDFADFAGRKSFGASRVEEYI